MQRVGTTLRTVVPRTLTTLERALVRDPGPDATAHAWLFEPASARRAAEGRLAALGVRARLRSAYKSLLHAFLEEIDLADAVAIDVSYPVVAGAHRHRFLLECHPLDALVGDRRLTFRPEEVREASDVGARDAGGMPALGHDIVLLGARAASGGSCACPFPRDGPRARPARRTLDACGWHDGPLRTDLETALDAALGHVERLPPPRPGPVPKRLCLRLEGPFEDEPLPVDQECVSLAEVAHEELLFGAMERLRGTGRPRDGVRGGAPGRQVAPLVRAAPGGDWTLEVGIEPAAATVPAATDAPPRVAGADPARLDRATSWLAPAAVDACLGWIGGEAFAATTRCGRTVNARRVRARGGGSGAAVVLSAGRHANETTGTVGALRAARELGAAGDVELAVAPLLNPDGHALFAECCDAFPRHMHHAGRYSALGADPAEDAADAGMRVLAEARRRTGATLHVDCHGYPAHEWTRPFAGYLPRGFEAWTIPRGFFLICRHAPGLRAEADRIVDACVRALNGLPGLMALNAEQLARRARYLPDEATDVRSGVPVFVGAVPDPAFPLCLVSEAPDETVHGERFRLLHEAQRRTVLAAVAEHGATVRDGAAPPA